MRVSTPGWWSAGRSRSPRRARWSPFASAIPPARPSSAPSSPISERLGDDRGEDLAPRRAERAQHPELGDPLGDGDREGVEDQEGADEEGDAGEDEQGDRRNPRFVADLVRLAVGVLLRGLDQDRGRVTFDPLLEALRRRRLGRDRDLVEAPSLPVTRCASGRVSWAMLAPPKEASPSLVSPTSR